MPEPPDFDQIARDLEDQANAITPLTKGMIYYSIKDGLRQAWNARGAADAQAVEIRIRELVAGEVVGAGIARHVADEIKKLDS